VPNRENLRSLLQARDAAEQQYYDLLRQSRLELPSLTKATSATALNSPTPASPFITLSRSQQTLKGISVAEDRCPSPPHAANPIPPINSDPHVNIDENDSTADRFENALARAGTVLIFIVCPCIACLYFFRRKRKALPANQSTVAPDSVELNAFSTTQEAEICRRPRSAAYVASSVHLGPLVSQSHTSSAELDCLFTSLTENEASLAISSPCLRASSGGIFERQSARRPVLEPIYHACKPRERTTERIPQQVKSRGRMGPLLDHPFKLPISPGRDPVDALLDRWTTIGKDLSQTLASIGDSSTEGM